MDTNISVNPIRFVKTLLISYAVTVVLLFLFALILYKMKLSGAQASMGVTVIYLISCGLGGFITGKQMRSRRLLWGLLSGALYFTILFLLSMLSGGGLSADLKNMFTVLGTCLAGSAAGAIIS